LTSLLLELKPCHHAVQMSKNRTEHLETKNVEAVVEAVDLMIKTEMIEEEEVEAMAEEAEAMAVAIEETAVIKETEVIKEIVDMEEEEITMEEVTGIMEILEAVEAETAVAGAATVEVQVGTKAQAATTTSDPSPKTTIETKAMIQIMVEALLTQVINFQLHQLPLTLKIIELKSTTTLNPKRNHNTLLDHRLTPLFI
jgi:hypothetical protein